MCMIEKKISCEYEPYARLYFMLHPFQLIVYIHDLKKTTTKILTVYGLNLNSVGNKSFRQISFILFVGRTCVRC